MTPAVARNLVALEDAPGGEHGEQADRQVHQEDPVPAGVLDNRAACDQAGGCARGAGEGERADGPALLGWSVEEPDDHAEGDRGRHRGAGALDEPPGDQHPGTDR
jgi:hypothetical protein